MNAAPADNPNLAIWTAPLFLNRAMPRYVILRHELPPDAQRPSHWDLMLECGPALRTWAINLEPGCVESDAQALGPHRLDYLGYEGPVGGNRGSVSRWDQGDYEVRHEDDRRLVIILSGQRLRGEMTLSQLDGQLWRCGFVPAPRSRGSSDRG